MPQYTPTNGVANFELQPYTPITGVANFSLEDAPSTSVNYIQLSITSNGGSPFKVVSQPISKPIRLLRMDQV